MPDFFRADLRGSRFERVDLSGAQFRTVDLSDTQFRAVYLKGTLMRGVELVDVDIYGEIGDLTINGVDIGPLVNAELDRRYPDRTKMRPTDPAGFAEAWDVVEQLWGGTVERAGKLDPELLHESVERVVVHRDAAAPGVCHRFLDQAGDPGRSVAVGSARSAMGRDA
jgi:hypothetical protein